MQTNVKTITILSPFYYLRCLTALLSPFVRYIPTVSFSLLIFFTQRTMISGMPLSVTVEDLRNIPWDFPLQPLYSYPV